MAAIVARADRERRHAVLRPAASARESGRVVRAVGGQCGLLLHALRRPR